MRFLPKSPRAVHLFLLIMILWKATEQAYIDERRMEAFLEGNVDGIANRLKGTVNQTIETKFVIIEIKMKEKFTGLDNKFTTLERNNKEKITALEESNKEKISALEAKFTALEENNKEKITALEEKNREKITTLEKNNKQKISALQENNKEKISALEAKFNALGENNKEKITALEASNKEKLTALEENNKALENKVVAALEQGKALKTLAWVAKLQYLRDTGMIMLSPYGSSKYLISPGYTSYDDKRMTCLGAGGNLASVETYAEWEHLYYEVVRVRPNKHYWLGGGCSGGSDYKWVTESVLTADIRRAFYSGYPNSCSGSDVYHIKAYVTPSYRNSWETAVSSNTAMAICEIVFTL